MSVPSLLELADPAVLERLHAEVQHADAAPLLAQAELAIEEERFEDAHLFLAGALTADPERARAFCALGRLAEEVGELEAAEQAYRRATEFEDEGAALDLAALLTGSGRFEEAVAIATALELEAGSAEVREGARLLAGRASARGARHVQG